MTAALILVELIIGFVILAVVVVLVRAERRESHVDHPRSDIARSGNAGEKAGSVTDGGAVPPAAQPERRRDPAGAAARR